MASNNIHYDESKIRTAASNIRSEIRKYEQAKNSLDGTVQGMKSYWPDETNQNYVSKYNKDLKPTADSVQKLMETFAKFLEDSADAVKKTVDSGNASING